VKEGDHPAHVARAHLFMRRLLHGARELGQVVRKGLRVPE
jgi:hypothetical protein